MENLTVKVEKVNDVLVTTSNRVAEELDILHKDLLKKIDGYVEKFGSENFRREFYIESTFENRGKKYRNYLITEKGIAQLIGGFSSAVEKAFDLNIAYINEFERMKNYIKESKIEVKREYKKIEESTPLELLERNNNALNGVFKDFNIPKELIISTAVNETKEMTGYEFQEVKKLLNKQDEEEYHNATYIAEKVGIKRDKINKVLILLELEKKGSSSVQKYILTELGKEYAIERTYTNHNHQGYQILWKDNVIEYVEEHYDDIPNSWKK